MIEQHTTSQTEQHSQLEAAKRRVQEILIELRSLAKTETDQNQFLNQVLLKTIETTAASGAAIWQIDGESRLALISEAGSSIGTLQLPAADIESHARLVNASIVNCQSMAIDPNTHAPADASVANPTAFLLLIHPLSESLSDRKFAIELFQRPDVNAAARSGYLRFLNEIGEIFIGWFARNELRRRAVKEQKSSRVLEFICDIHGSLNPMEVAYAAANDGRVLIDCDRLSVISFTGRRSRVLAVSGQDDFDNRSNIVQKQQRLAAMLRQNPQMVWLGGGGTAELPRGLQRVVEDYQNEAHARTLVIAPLFEADLTDPETQVADDASASSGPSEPIGAMIAEWFAVDIPRTEREYEFQMITDNVGRALANAQTHQSIFLLPVWTLIGKWKWLIQAKTLPKTIAVTIAILVLLAFFTLYPYPFNMRVDGWLQPVQQRNVFANINGVIEHVHVKHGQQVKKGELLLELTNDDLEYQLTSTRGQLLQIKKEIRSTQTTALTESDDNQSELAAARLGGLKEKELSIIEQLGKLQTMQKKLKIYSPIDGTVVSWDPVRQLAQRPVSQQDVVLVIADVNAKWHMELFIPERKYGHVVSYSEEPKITFFAATDPQHTFEGQVTSIEGHASEHEGYGSTVRAFADFDQDNSPDLYVGAAVTAKIHCGTSSIGYAWFHEIIEFVQSRLLF